MSFICGDFYFASSPSQIHLSPHFYGDWGCRGDRVPGGVATFDYVPLWLYDFSAGLLNAHQKMKMKQGNNRVVLLSAATNAKIPILEAKVCIFGSWRCQSCLKMAQYAWNRHVPSIQGVGGCIWWSLWSFERLFNFLPVSPNCGY